MTGALYQRGDEVLVFYRMDKRCEHHRKYLAVLDPRHGAYRPRMGMAEGWIPAKVAAEHNSENPEVCIEYRWPHFYNKQGQVASSSSLCTEWFPTKHVCKAPAASTSRLSLVRSDFQPELSIIAFRWGGRDEILHSPEWGETGTSASDTFFEHFLGRAVEPYLHTNYEVWIVYIEDHSDMAKIANTAQLIFGPNHPARRAKKTCAMYFLYPTAFEESCESPSQMGDNNGTGLVDQKSLLRMMKSVERAGVPTRFPHYSGLYEQLASKSWTYRLTLTPHLRIPPTVAVPRSIIEGEDGCAVAARLALDSLRDVKRQQAILRGEVDANLSGEITQGVTKLGFSWGALDVKFWQGLDGLDKSISDLTQTVEIGDELTSDLFRQCGVRMGCSSQAQDCSSLIVQEYIPHDVELRIYTVNGNVEAMIYTKFCSINANQEFGSFKQHSHKEDVVREWMAGDSAAFDDGERQCLELTQHWLAWLRSQACEVPPAIRFDFLVGRTAAKPGKATVWTLELCELGFSMLGHKHLPDKVFGAMLRSCLWGCQPEMH